MVAIYSLFLRNASWLQLLAMKISSILLWGDAPGQEYMILKYHRLQDQADHAYKNWYNYPDACIPVWLQALWLSNHLPILLQADDHGQYHLPLQACRPYCMLGRRA